MPKIKLPVQWTIRKRSLGNISKHGEEIYEALPEVTGEKTKSDSVLSPQHNVDCSDENYEAMPAQACGMNKPNSIPGVGTGMAGSSGLRNKDDSAMYVTCEMPGLSGNDVGYENAGKAEAVSNTRGHVRQ